VRRKKAQINRVVEGLKKEIKKAQVYEENKPPILSAMEIRLLNSLADPSKLAQATTRDAAQAFKVIHSANRLEQGKSTSNAAVSFTISKVDLKDSKLK